MDSLIKIIETKIANFSTTDALIQGLILLIAFLVAFFVTKSWKKYLDTQLGNKEQQGFSRFILRGSGYIVLPIISLAIIYIGTLILKHYEIKTTGLNVIFSLLLSLAAVRVSVYSLRRAFTNSANLHAWEGLISTVIWSAVALHLLGWLPDILTALDSSATKFGDSRISILSVIKFIIIVGIYIVIARWLTLFIEHRAKQSSAISSSMQVGLTKFSSVFLYSIAIIVALNTVGIDLTALAVFGGAIGVGLGFGLQRIASNFISGFILLFDRSIKPGDVITVGDRFGWVVALHARYIVVKDRDGVETLIPNENIITSEVTNWSYSDKHVRVKVPLQVSYNDDVELAMQLMLDACKISTRVLKKPEPTVRLVAFEDSGIKLELRLWLDDPEQGVGSVKSDINLAVWKAFKENNVTIPYPQRDVHIVKTE